VRTLSRICVGLASFLLVAGAVYTFTAHEPSGATGLLIASATFGYLALVTHRSATAEEEAAEGSHEEAEEAAAPTIWPFSFAISGVVLALGLIVDRWILVLAVVGLAVSAAGWIRDVARAHARGSES